MLLCKPRVNVSICMCVCVGAHVAHVNACSHRATSQHISSHSPCLVETGSLIGQFAPGILLSPIAQLYFDFLKNLGIKLRSSSLSYQNIIDWAI